MEVEKKQPVAATSYKILQKIDGGTYCDVYRALRTVEEDEAGDRERREQKQQEQNTNQKPVVAMVAVKLPNDYLLKLFPPSDYGWVNPLELSISSTLRHPSIISCRRAYVADPRLHGSTSSTDAMHALVMPLADTNLHQKILCMSGKTAGVGMSGPARLQLFYEICRGTAYLLRHGILHLDLTPRNVLMFGKQPKIADFGIAALAVGSVDHVVESSEVLITVFSRPPENLRDPTCGYNASSVIWQLGIMLMFVGGGETPRTTNDATDAVSVSDEAKAEASVLAWIDKYLHSDGQRRHTFNCFLRDNWTADQKDQLATACQLGSWMLDLDASKRPTIDQVLAHPLFDDCRRADDVDQDDNKKQQVQQSATGKTEDNNNNDYAVPWRAVLNRMKRAVYFARSDVQEAWAVNATHLLEQTKPLLKMLSPTADPCVAAWAHALACGYLSWKLFDVYGDGPSGISLCALVQVVRQVKSFRKRRLRKKLSVADVLEMEKAVIRALHGRLHLMFLSTTPLDDKSGKQRC